MHCGGDSDALRLVILKTEEERRRLSSAGGGLTSESCFRRLFGTGHARKIPTRELLWPEAARRARENSIEWIVGLTL